MVHAVAVSLGCLTWALVEHAARSAKPRLLLLQRQLGLHGKMSSRLQTSVLHQGQDLHRKSPRLRFVSA
jgi:hypothetical protein